MLKPVRSPPGATAVGIPARVVEAEDNNGRFAAYAVGRDENDPLTGAINELISHSSDTDKRIEELRAAMEQMSQLLLAQSAQSAQQAPEHRDKKRA